MVSFIHFLITPLEERCNAKPCGRNPAYAHEDKKESDDPFHLISPVNVRGELCKSGSIAPCLGFVLDIKIPVRIFSLSVLLLKFELFVSQALCSVGQTVL